MNLNTLKPALGEKSIRKRVGRGMGSGTVSYTHLTLPTIYSV